MAFKGELQPPPNESEFGCGTDGALGDGESARYVNVHVHIELEDQERKTIRGRWTPIEACCTVTKTQLDQLGVTAQTASGQETRGPRCRIHESFGWWAHMVYYAGERRPLHVTFCVTDKHDDRPITLAGKEFRPQTVKKNRRLRDNTAEATPRQLNIAPITVEKQSAEERIHNENKRKERDASNDRDEKNRDDRRQKRTAKHKADKAASAQPAK